MEVHKHSRRGLTLKRHRYIYNQWKWNPMHKYQTEEIEETFHESVKGQSVETKLKGTSHPVTIVRV